MKLQEQGEVTWPPFAQKLIARGEARGRAEGKAEGKVEGKAEGKAEGKREVLLKLIAHAGIMLTEGQRARIEACTDPGLLDHWVDNAMSARTAEAIFR